MKFGVVSGSVGAIHGRRRSSSKSLQVLLAFSLVVSTSCVASRELSSDRYVLEQISDSGAGAYEVSLTTLDDGFAAAWYDHRDGNPEIYLRILDRDGRPQGPEHRLTDNASLSYEADVASIGDRLAVAWYERSGLTYETKLGVWSRDGTELWVRTISRADRNGRIPVVGVHGDEIFCAWLEDDAGGDFEIWAGWWDLEGQPLAEPRLLAPAGGRTWNLNAKIDEAGMAWIVFDAAVDTAVEELYLVQADRSGSERVRLTSDDGHVSKYPDLALGPDRVALTWFDEREGNREVYLFVATPDRLEEGFEIDALRVTDTPGASIGSYVAWNGSRLGLVWNDNTQGQHEVYFQRFNVEGQPLEGHIRATDTPAESLIPAIQAWEDGFAIVWNEWAPGEGGGHASDGESEIVFLVLQ